ncbi:MAG TPA: type II secretion system F family protein [Stellaceae bacterium]|nr:type II secretion system F family protein [Stellaceae bacterium]
MLDDPATVVPLLLSALAFVTVIALALPWIEPDIFASRLKVITQRRGELSQQRKQRLEQQRPSLRRALAPGRVTFMRAVIAKLRLDNIMEQPELRKKLVRAGKRSQQALVTFAFLRIALPILFGGVTALVTFGSPNIHLAPALGILSCLGAAGLGFLLPGILVVNAITKRQQEIQRKFPDALDLMVICVESGISLEAAFSRVAEEMATEAPALSEEVALTTAELSFLSDRRQALGNLAERTGTPSVKSLVTSLVQSDKYGTPLGAALRVVAQEGRDARMARAEEKAAALPAKLTVPMVAFFLPVLFVVMIGPTIIQVIRLFAKS